jgi:hypothetical protein
VVFKSAGSRARFQNGKRENMIVEMRKPRGMAAVTGLWLLLPAAYGLLVGVAAAAPTEPLSAFTNELFDPDGEIDEFINVAGDSQEYFVADPTAEGAGDPDFGAIKAAASLTRGVLVRRDNFPIPGDADEAGRSGFRDRPAVINGVHVPTGFNIGRVFASFNPNAYGGEGAYFFAFDISAPAMMDPVNSTQPVAFDVDGDGSRFLVADAPLAGVAEQPVTSEDIYGLNLDVDLDGLIDIRVKIQERAGNTVPFGSVAIDPPCCGEPCPGCTAVHPTGCPAAAQVINGVCVRRYVLFEDGTGMLPGTPPDQARVFLDADDNGVLDHRDFGVGSDIEFALRNLVSLCETLGCDPACVDLSYLADTFDDQPLGGGAEDLVRLQARFPYPDLEVIKEAKCVDEDDDAYRTRVNAVPGSEVVFRIQIQNHGNRDLEVTLTDVLSRVAPATASLVPGSCSVVGAAPAGIIPGFCAAFENRLTNSTFPLNIGVLAAGDDCATELGDELVFTFRVLTGPTAPNTALCDQGIDVTNAVTVTGETTDAEDPILAPDPPLPEPVALLPNAEEEDCNNGACCSSRPACSSQEICQEGVCVTVICASPACVAGDGTGDVVDEFTLAVEDVANVIDTRREIDNADDDNVAEVELECRNITFRKEVRRQGSPTFQTGDDAVNLPGDDASYPLRVEYKFTIQNTGEGTESFTLSDTNHCNDIALAAGVATVAGQCPLCDPPTPGVLDGTVVAGGTFMTTCVVEFSDRLSTLAFMGRDDARPAVCQGDLGGNANPLCYKNCAEASVSFGTPTGPVVCDEGADFTSFATVCQVIECELEVTKTVQCLDACPTGNPVGPAGDSVETVPGACVQFTMTVENTGPVNIPLVCLTDTRDCTWAISGFAADINGVNVTADLAGFGPNSGRDCFTFPSHPGGIRVGETLTIRFNFRVPSPFPILGDSTDCTNTLSADGYRSESADTSEPPDEGCTDIDSASVDVKVPRIDCNKTVTVDLGNDGSVDIPATSSANITNVAYPLRLVYTFTARNTGELPIMNAQVCDNSLVAHARAAGASVGPCALCNDPGCDGVGDNCASLGTLNPGDPPAVRTCTIIFADQAQFNDFAGRDSLDGRNDCYTNAMEASGDIEPECAPPGFPREIESGNCTAIVCISEVPECPVIKAKFDIWNENERRFSGTERCLISWDQRLLSMYTAGGSANHFKRQTLQTDKGKARIDGIASSVVCGEDSISAPLLGVSATLLKFEPRRLEAAAKTLVGSGTETGLIRYEPTGPPSGGTPATPGLPDATARANVTVKGSLLVYSKVEIKWNSNFDVIQDTILDIANDNSADVSVLFYLVNGDQPTLPIPPTPTSPGERGHLGCNAVNTQLTLTGNQPAYWSALTGDPLGLNPFTILDPGTPPGRPDTDPGNPGGRVLRGYVLAWAVNSGEEEIRWNHLIGDAVVVHYPKSMAWEYNAWSFPAVAGVNDGDLLLLPLGQLNLDGVEYAFAPNFLIMDFYASGAVLRSMLGASATVVDTDLTLWAASKDLRQP